MSTFVAELILLTPVIAAIMFILYFVIINAVKEGINRSVIGRDAMDFKEEKPIGKRSFFTGKVKDEDEDEEEDEDEKDEEEQKNESKEKAQKIYGSKRRNKDRYKNKKKQQEKDEVGAETEVRAGTTTAAERASDVGTEPESEEKTETDDNKEE